MSSRLKSQIIQTLVYSDIFNYPLTINQIYKFLIGSNEITKDKISKEIKKIKSVSNLKEFFFLKGRENIVYQRIEREKESKKKLLLAKKAASCLSVIPKILLIGLSGNLAMNNAKKDDDIDFFIITEKDSIWLARFLSIWTLDVLGLRRKRIDKKVSNKICLNMFVDEDALNFNSRNHDLYTAHEITQMVPLFERKNMYKRFLHMNKWVVKYLPNSLNIQKLNRELSGNKIYKSRQHINILLLNYLVIFLEFFTKKIQLWYMRKHKTTEIITDKFLAFHPFNHKDRILKIYKRRIRDLET